MLTGSDPLEAAIAAGETPSPELVAAAGEAEGLRPAVAWSLLAVVLAGLALVPLAGPELPAARAASRSGSRRPCSRTARATSSRRVAASEPAIDDAWGLSVDWGYLGEVREKDPSPSRWDALAKGNPPVLQFWYRESPRPLVSLLPSGKVYGAKPGLDVDRHGGRHLRHGGAPPALLRRPAAARGRRRRRRPSPSRTGRRSSPRRGSTPAPFRAVEPEVGRRPSSPTRARRGRGPGRVAPTSPSGSRPPPTAGSRCGSRSCGRGRGPSGWRSTPGRRGSSSGRRCASPWRSSSSAPPPSWPAATSCSGGGTGGGPSASRCCSRGLASLSWALGAHHVADWNAADRASSPAGRAWSCSRRRSCGSSTSRSSPTRAGCGPGRSCPGRVSSAAGSATRSWAGTRSSASPGPCSCSSLVPAAARPATRSSASRRPEPMGGYLDPLTGAGPLLGSTLGAGERGRSSSPWG